MDTPALTTSEKWNQLFVGILRDPWGCSYWDCGCTCVVLSHARLDTSRPHTLRLIGVFLTHTHIYG